MLVQFLQGIYFIRLVLPVLILSAMVTGLWLSFRHACCMVLVFAENVCNHPPLGVSSFCRELHGPMPF